MVQRVVVDLTGSASHRRQALRQRGEGHPAVQVASDGSCQALCRAKPAGRRRVQRDRATRGEEPEAAGRVERGRRTSALHEPPVVHHAGRRRPRRRAGAGACQRRPPSRRIMPLVEVSASGTSSDERGEADRDERPLAMSVEDGRQVEELVEPDVGEQVQAGVEEREQPEHAPEADERVPAGQPRAAASWRA